MIRKGPSGFRGDGVSRRTNCQDRVRSLEGARAVMHEEEGSPRET